jgi:elongation factor G
MAQKSAETAAVTTDPGQVRNVVLVGHSGAGKTALVEALLTATGADPSGVRGPGPASLTCAPLLWTGTKINLLDPPGDARFAGELYAGLRAADAVVFVVSAGHGLDDATVALWEECAALELPRAVVISRLDDPGADYQGTLEDCQEAFGENVLPVYQPMLGDDGESITGLLGLITLRVLDYSAGYPPVAGEAERAHLTPVEDARSELIEAVLAESEDESLMERYVAGELITTATLVPDLEQAVARGHFYPVLPVCAATGVGLDALLDGLVAGAPSPLGRELPVVTEVDGSPRPPLTGDPGGPLVAEVVRTTAGGPAGPVALVRVFSGTLRPGQPLHVAGPGRPGNDAREQVTHIYSPLEAPQGEVGSCVAGDICAITVPGRVETGDTLSSREEPLLLEPWRIAGAMAEPR